MTASVSPTPKDTEAETVERVWRVLHNEHFNDGNGGPCSCGFKGEASYHIARCAVAAALAASPAVTEGERAGGWYASRCDLPRCLLTVGHVAEHWPASPAVTAEPPRCRDHGYVNPCDLCVRDHPPAAAVPEAEAGREATKRWAQTATPAEQDAYDRGLAVGRSAPAEEKCEDFDSQTDGRLAKWRAVNNAHYPPSSEPTKLRALMALADEEVAASAAAQERCHRCDHSKASHLGSEGPCLRDFCSCPEHLAGPRDDTPQADR